MLLSKCDVNSEQTYKLWLSHNCLPKGRGEILGAHTTKNPNKPKSRAISAHCSTDTRGHYRNKEEYLTSNNVKPLQAQVPAYNFNSKKVLTFPSHQQDFYRELILCMPPVKTIDSGKAPAPILLGYAQNTILITAIYRCTCESYSCTQTELYFRSSNPDLSSPGLLWYNPLFFAF